MSGFGLAASLEGGYPFELGSDWVLEPQVQQIFQTIDFDSFNDGAAEVSFSDFDSLNGRVGARLSRTWEVDENGSTQPPRLMTA